MKHLFYLLFGLVFLMSCEKKTEEQKLPWESQTVIVYDNNNHPCNIFITVMNNVDTLGNLIKKNGFVRVQIEHPENTPCTEYSKEIISNSFQWTGENLTPCLLSNENKIQNGTLTNTNGKIEAKINTFSAHN